MANTHAFANCNGIYYVLIIQNKFVRTCTKCMEIILVLIWTVMTLLKRGIGRMLARGLTYGARGAALQGWGPGLGPGPGPVLLIVLLNPLFMVQSLSCALVTSEQHNKQSSTETNSNSK